MDNAEADQSTSLDDTSILSRNRSFKSKQLVRSQAIRESQSPPRAFSPAQSAKVATDTTDAETRTPSVAANVTDNLSHCSGRSSDVSSSDLKVSHLDDYKKKQPVEIQITSGACEATGDTEQRQRSRRWLGHAHSESSRDLLSNQPRVSCVCGACAACSTCRGRRQRQQYHSKQDSGIGCSDECPDCPTESAGASNNEVIRKTGSLEVEDQIYNCRCPERKERPKDISLSKIETDERQELSWPELVKFIKETLNKSPRDRVALLKIEKELHTLVSDTGRCVMRFPVMTSYGRMLVHRCAALFQLSHHLDQVSKTCVLVSKGGTSGGRLPCTNFKEWCVASFPPSPQKHQPIAPNTKSILKRDTHSLDEPDTGTLASNRSKSLEQREREYERVRKRIFSSDDCAQQDEYPWPWLSPGPVKLLTPEGNRNKLLKVQSLETSEPGSRGSNWRARSSVSKSHSFGGYATENQPQRVLSKQGDLASSSWRLSPSSSGYKTLSLRSTDSITPSPTGGASPEPATSERVVWCVSDVSAVPAGAVLIHPQTGRPLTNPDGSVYHFDPAHPPVLYDTSTLHTDQVKMDQSDEKRRGRLEKQHSFMDSECECQPVEECSKCCCECPRQAGCQRNPTDKNAQEANIKSVPLQNINVSTAPIYAQEKSIQNPTCEKTPNQKTPESAYHRQIKDDQPANQKFENKSYKESAPNRNVQSNNEGSQELQQYSQAYVQGYRTDELSPEVSQYVPPEVAMQPPTYTSVAPAPVPDPNIQSMPSTNLIYPTAVAQGYPYQHLMEQPMQVGYQQIAQAPEDPNEPTAATHTTDTTFRIDPSYPYATVDYTAATCSTCVDAVAMQQHQQRSYSVPYGQVEVPPVVMSQYPAGSVMMPQPHMQPYPYQEPLQWGSMAPAPKIMVPEVYSYVPYPPAQYQHYNFMYPQVMPQPYPVYQPVYPAPRAADPQPPQRRDSATGTRHKWNIPIQEERVSYEEENIDFFAKMQQITAQMEQIRTREKDNNRDERRRNSGNGLLGNYFGNTSYGGTVGRNINDEPQLSPAARAIVNSIRSMQAKTTIHEADRCRWPNRFDSRADGRRPRDDGDGIRYDPSIQAFSVTNDHAKNRIRQQMLLRQMSPGMWSQRSPAPMQSVLNSRRPHPEQRYPRL